MIEPSWVERVLNTQRFHSEHCKIDERWTLRDTSRELSRSVGRISEDLLLATYLKTHEERLKKFTYVQDALEFVKRLKREARLAV